MGDLAGSWVAAGYRMLRGYRSDHDLSPTSCDDHPAGDDHCANIHHINNNNNNVAGDYNDGRPAGATRRAGVECES